MCEYVCECVCVCVCRAASAPGPPPTMPAQMSVFTTHSFTRSISLLSISLLAESLHYLPLPTSRYIDLNLAISFDLFYSSHLLTARSRLCSCTHPPTYASFLFLSQSPSLYVVARPTPLTLTTRRCSLRQVWVPVLWDGPPRAVFASKALLVPLTSPSVFVSVRV